MYIDMYEAQIGLSGWSKRVQTYRLIFLSLSSLNAIILSLSSLNAV